MVEILHNRMGPERGTTAIHEMPLGVLKVFFGPRGINVGAEGYGTATEEGDGWPIYIEFDPDTGMLNIYVWDDINREDPTYSIPMDAAQVERREYRVVWPMGQGRESHDCPKCGYTMYVTDGDFEGVEDQDWTVVCPACGVVFWFELQREV